jgi:erythromycin esterase-like protein
MSRELQRFIAESAVRLPEPFDGATADTALLAPLDPLIARADIVVLGELNHFVHEKSDFRLFFARYLAARGWTNFAEELGRSDGVRVDRFYETGDAAELDRLPSFGHRTHLREDRDDRPTGLFKRSFETYPADLFRAEQGRFYRGLRTVAGGPRIRHFGFDIDGLPGGSYEDIAVRLAPFANDPRLGEFHRALARVQGESATAEAERIRGVRQHMTALKNVAGASVAAEIDMDLAALSDSLDYVVATYPAETYDAIRPGMAMREDMMKRRIAEIRSLCGADKRLVLMAHALHLAKNDAAIAGSAQSVGPGGGGTCSLGHHLAQELGLRVASIWFVYGGGEDSQPFDELPRRAHYPRDTLNRTLAAFGAPLFFLTGNADFAQPSKIGHMYNAVVEVPLGAQTDAIFFLPSVSRLRM